MREREHEIDHMFHELLREEVWCVEEYNAANKWLSQCRKFGVKMDFPWDLFEACRNVKALERRGILTRQEYDLEREWLYKLFCTPGLEENNDANSLASARYRELEDTKKRSCEPHFANFRMTIKQTKAKIIQQQVRDHCSVD